MSVIIATRNRSRRLRETFSALERVEYPGDRWQLVVVDNRSTDDTGAVARAALERYAVPAQVVLERELGLSAARNAGVRHAEGELVVFLDDDALPAPGWLAALQRTLGEPEVLAAGGPVEPRFEGELPPWFPPSFLPYLSAWDLGRAPLDLSYNEYPRGANLGFRRPVFDRFGWFSRQLGRRGRRLRSCEEIEYCLRLERGGGRIVYAPEARVEHLVPVDRLTAEWLVERCRWQGTSEAIVEWRHGGVAALRSGLARQRRYLRAAAREHPADSLSLRTQRAALTGYRRMSLLAPLVVPRYRRDLTGRPAAPWSPFG